MSSDNEQQDQHSIWNGRFKANPKEAKFFLEIIDKLGAQFDGMPVEEIIQTFWGEDRDVLEKLIKKANKREKKEEAKFTVKGMKRAPTANILFQKAYNELCKKNGTKFNLKNCIEEYKKLSDKEKDKYKKEAVRLKTEYLLEYERLRTDAIKNGDFPEDKPKRPQTAFLRYLADVREQIAEKYKNIENRKSINAQISKDAGEMWNALSDAEKAPYEIAYKKARDIFDEKLQTWEINETERRKKQDNPTNTIHKSKNQSEPTNVEIEIAGTKSNFAKTNSKKPNAQVEPFDIDNDNDNDTEQQIQKPNTKPKSVSKISAKTVKVTSDTETEADDNISESEPEPIVVAKTKKTVTKPKKIIESDTENDIPQPIQQLKKKK